MCHAVRHMCRAVRHMCRAVSYICRAVRHIFYSISHIFNFVSYIFHSLPQFESGADVDKDELIELLQTLMQYSSKGKIGYS